VHDVWPLVAVDVFASCAGGIENLGATPAQIMPTTNSHTVSKDHLPNGTQHDCSSTPREVQLEGATGHVPEKPEDVPPDGGYGWVCTGCNFFINAHTWGINSVSSFL